MFDCPDDAAVSNHPVPTNRRGSASKTIAGFAASPGSWASPGREATIRLAVNASLYIGEF